MCGCVLSYVWYVSVRCVLSYVWCVSVRYVGVCVVLCVVCECEVCCLMYGMQV